MRRTATIAILTSFAITGCVSVSIGGNEPKRAQDVRFTAPPQPFQQEDRADVDMSWRHRDNGNAISFLSDCQDATDPDLDTIANGVFSGLNDLTYTSRDTLEYRKREA